MLFACLSRVLSGFVAAFFILLISLAVGIFADWLVNFVLNLLGDQVEEGAVLDGYAEQGLLELIIAEPDMVLFGSELIASHELEDIDDVLGLHDEGGQLEGSQKHPPSIVDDLVVVFLLSEGEVGVLEQEVEDGLKVGAVLLQHLPDGLTFVQLRDLALHLLFWLQYFLVVLLDLLPKLLPQFFLMVLFLFLFVLGLLDLFDGLVADLLDPLELSLVDYFELLLVFLFEGLLLLLLLQFPLSLLFILLAFLR